MSLRKKSSVLSVGVIAFALLGLFVSGLVFADGMLIAPPGKKIYETDQRAVIFYDEGVENLFLSITFQGDAKDFAWIVPTPSKPEVGKSTVQLFQRLEQLTRPEYPQVDNRNKGLFLGETGVAPSGGVTVLESKQIEYYDISVLESSDAQALYNWLNDNGYRFVQSGNHIVEDYIQKGWVFTAIKINREKENIAQGQLVSGNAVPLKLSFKTDQIVYPLRISSLSGLEDNAPAGQISYVDGVEGGKAVKVDSDRLISTDMVIPGFSAGNGKTSFYLKKRDSEGVGKIISIRSKNNQGLENESISISNRQKNVFQISINHRYQEEHQVDLGSDFKQNEWQKYEFVWEPNANNVGYSFKFFIDGVERTLNKRYSYPSQMFIGDGLGRVVVGGEYFETAYSSSSVDPSGDPNTQRGPSRPQISVSRPGDLIIDKLEINSSQKNVFRAEFDENLDVSLADGAVATLRVFERSDMYGGASNFPKNDSMGVLLYVFAEKKYDIPGFDQQYAGWMSGKDIENIAKIDGTTSWITPAKDKYFLTRSYKYMQTSEMTEDIYPLESEDQTSFNFAGGEENRLVWVFILIGLSFVSILAMVMYVVARERGRSFLPMKNGNLALMKKEDKNK